MILRAIRLLPVIATTALALSALPALADSGTAGKSAGKPGWQQVGEASFYSSKYAGQRTASGKLYDPAEMTAAHPWLPLGTKLRVLREDSGKSVVVTVTDRQAENGRVLDLSRNAAAQLGMLSRGTAKVRLIALSASDSLNDEPRTMDDQPPASRAGARHRGHARHAALSGRASQARHASRSSARSAVADIRVSRRIGEVPPMQFL